MTPARRAGRRVPWDRLVGAFTLGAVAVAARDLTTAALAAALLAGLVAPSLDTSPSARAGRLGLLLLLGVALSADGLAPAGPEAWATPAAPPSWQHPFGGDALGRDRFARWVWGARTAALVAVPVALLATGLGTALGLLAGWRGGRVDAAVQWIVDLALSTPTLLVQIAVVGVLRPTGSASLLVVICALTLTSWADTARLVRAEARALARAGHVEAARVLGLPAPTLLRHHVLPHLLPTVTVLAAAAAGHALLAEAAMSYLGLGLDLTFASWGRSFQGTRALLAYAPAEPLAYAGSVAFAALCTHLVADGVRDVTDPRHLPDEGAPLASRDAP